MLKFFRKIRQKLLSENGFSKYLIYAIGEIILVVLGILIAVGINSWYNAKKNENKIKTILIQAQSEILTDLKDAKRISRIFINKDSLSRNILNDAVSAETDLWKINFTNNWVDFNTSKNGYLRLIENIENLPGKYKVLLPDFNFLYVVFQADIENANAALRDIAKDHKFNRIHSDPELADYMMGRYSKEETVDYYLNNPLLKNKTIHYAMAFCDLYEVVNIFSIYGISLYEKIDSVLGVQNAEYPWLFQMLPPNEIINPYFGDYGGINDTKEDDPKGSFLVQNGQLIARINGRKSRFLWIDETYFFMEGDRNIYRFYRNNKGQRLCEISNGIINLTFINRKDID